MLTPAKMCSVFPDYFSHKRVWTTTMPNRIRLLLALACLSVLSSHLCQSECDEASRWLRDYRQGARNDTDDVWSMLRPWVNGNCLKNNNTGEGDDEELEQVLRRDVFKEAVTNGSDCKRKVRLRRPGRNNRTTRGRNNNGTRGGNKPSRKKTTTTMVVTGGNATASTPGKSTK